MPTINDSVQFLKGVGPAFAKKFEKLGILTRLHAALHRRVRAV